MEIISGEKLQQLADIAIVTNSNPNYKIYSRQYFNIKTDNINNKSHLFSDANIFYVKTDYLWYFVSHILPRITKKFILITHNSDYTIGSGHMELLNDTKLIKWYGQNINISHPKLHALPIGIANSQWAHGKTEILERVMIETKPNPKTKLLYVNFSVDTNPDIREPLRNLLTSKGYEFTFPNLQWQDYLYELSKYKYAICPEGNGPDCHRIWECLYLGVIPIVKKSVAFVQFDDLPILFVGNWNQINDNFLNSQLTKFESKKYNTDKLNMKYWDELIRSQF